MIVIPTLYPMSSFWMVRSGYGVFTRISQGLFEAQSVSKFYYKLTEKYGGGGGGEITDSHYHMSAAYI